MTASPVKGQTVAVVGLGALRFPRADVDFTDCEQTGAMGIVAVKNLTEAGFDATGFERSSYVGGLWHYTDDEDTLSVLKGV